MSFLPCFRPSKEKSDTTLKSRNEKKRRRGKRQKKSKQNMIEDLEQREVRIVWDLPILDLVAVFLSVVSIIITLYLTRNVSNLHQHVTQQQERMNRRLERNQQSPDKGHNIPRTKPLLNDESGSFCEITPQCPCAKRKGPA